MFQFDFFLNNIIWDDVPTQFLPWSPLFYGCITTKKLGTEQSCRT
ncbi:hypothetical protein GQ55_1G165500 [Panicum hallii var. hallii]|uniref:Uncharacterized protein n=1 Tax=Panicum hallii var. hallii TaxID=1504633 RepID=A0A2T7F5Q9_9POAL|nr:hypothetical protein GQ55_1G165500 [Panicum hallii var. hallii]